MDYWEENETYATGYEENDDITYLSYEVCPQCRIKATKKNKNLICPRCRTILLSPDWD